VPPDRGDHGLQRCLGRVVIEAEIARRDAPFGLDRGRLGEQQAGARKGEMPEMDHVPVIRLPALRGVLAHRRDHDAIPQGQATQRDR